MIGLMAQAPIRDNYEEGLCRLSRKPTGEGLYIEGKVEDSDVYMLIDTGATVSLMSHSKFQELSEKRTWELEKPAVQIYNVSEQKMQVNGVVNMSLEVGFRRMLQPLYVVDMEACDILLGLDFLEANKCVLDLRGKMLRWQDQCVPLQFQKGEVTCRRIFVKETVLVLAGHEMLLPGRVEAKAGKGDIQFTGIIEPTENFVERFELLMAPSVQRNGDEGVMLRVLNPGDEDRLIYKGTTVATLSSVLALGQSINTEEEEELDKSAFIRACIVRQEVDVEGLGLKVPEHLRELFEESLTELDKKQTQDVAQLLEKYQDVFMKPDEKLRGTELVKHKIDVGNTNPIKQPPRRTPFHQKQLVEEEIEKMLADDIIEPAEGPWASPVVLVRKKDGSVRFCVDFRRVNDVTKKDAYPIPRIDDTLDALSGSMFFSTLDLHSGYWQVKMEDVDKEKTAFSSHVGLFQFKRMAFGLCNAPSTFERLMERVLHGLQWHVCLLYLDDIVVFSRDFSDHISRLAQVFDRLRGADLKMKVKKCSLFQTEVEYLGHVISRDGITTSQDKILKVRDWPVPKTSKQVRQFIGLTTYYRRFVQDYAKIARPLHQLTEKGKHFKWTSDCAEAFELLKEKLVSAPILAYPDMTQGFILDTDASDLALGGVLSQILDGHERVIAYASFALSKPERNYSVTRRELYAVVRMCRHFKTYLYGKRFLLRTDHGSLRWLTNFKEPEGQLARWLEILSEFDMDIQHRAGRSHGNADALSRIPEEMEMEKEEICAKVTTKVVVEIESLSKEELRRTQLDDKDLGRVMGWLEEEKVKPSWQEITAYSPEVKALWGLWDNLKVREGVLYLEWEDLNGQELDRLVTPKSLQTPVLTQLHNVETAGHLGYTKVLNKATQRFYWYKMKASIRRWVNNCLACAKRKGPHSRIHAPLQQYRVGAPLERLQIDIVGPLPVSEEKNKYILVITDCFTKFTEAFPLKDMEATTVANKLVFEFISRYGVPDEIQSDQGRQFESQVFQEMCKLLGINKTRSSPYHPQANGQVERFNRTLEDMLSKYAVDHQRDWDRFVPLVLFAYRASKHESTGETPNALMFGRQVRLPLDVAWNLPGIREMPTHEYAIQLEERFHDINERAREHLGKAGEYQKQYYNRKVKTEEFEKGDAVMLAVTARKVGVSPKLQARWDGPFIVIAKFGDVNIKIQKDPRSKAIIVHVDRVKRFQGTYENAWVWPKETKARRPVKAPQRYGEWKY